MVDVVLVVENGPTVEYPGDEGRNGDGEGQKRVGSSVILGMSILNSVKHSI